ncbi:MAG TPA: MASE1 domain-containing protein [Candidatus Eisenbacteria bacterium]|nr:MASE1 domain-containing protein [Candidatus Eisenbacteria bacterium]
MLATALVYFAAAKLGLTMAFSAEQVTLVWPPSGIALASVVLLGRRWVVPGIALGAFLANATANEPLGTAAGIAVGNTLEALIGAWLLERAHTRPALDRLRDVLALVALAAACSTMASATIGVVSLCLGGVQPWSASATLWWTWWIGDALGDLVTAPLLLVWATAQPALLPSERRGEAATLLLATFAVGAVVFAGRHVGPLAGYPFHYAVFPLVVWAALRFGQRGTATVTFVTAALAISNTVRGSGPFTGEPVEESLFLLQLFMAIVSVTGLLLGAAITERDVARRQVNREYDRLQASEQRLRFALAAGRMGVWDWNITSGEVKWSDNLEAIHGLTPGSFPGTFEGFRRLVHPDDHAKVDAAIARAVEEGTDYEIDYRNLRSDGTVGWINGIGHVLSDAHDRPERMIGVAMDATERHRMTAELAAHARDLADAARRKDEFLAMLSHELRNPLAPLHTALELLRRGVGARALDIAERQLKQLVRLVDDLLDVSRITQGKIVLRKEPTALDDVVARAVDSVRPLLDERGHAFDLRLPAERIWVDGDPARLTQVFANLLGNAVKYTPANGSISLVVDTTGDGVGIRVRDTGVGIPADLLPRVFDLFVQGERSLDRSHGGLGLGLTIVRRLVELHGGRVEARSPGGTGCEIVVDLPRLPSALVPKAEPAVRPARPVAPARVLIVEDNEDSAESLSELFESLGHEVRVAATAGAALEVVGEWTPDVVVSDIGLPGMDGYQLVRALRERKTLDRTMFIALSGYGRDEDRQLAMEAGFDHHFVKPPDIDALAALLGRPAAAGAEGVSRALS